MNKKLLSLSIIPVVVLSGCNGLVKCDFETFKDASTKAVEKAPKEFKQVKFKGRFNGLDVDYTYRKDEIAFSVGASYLVLVAPFFNVVSTYVFETMGDPVYYKGSGFKVVFDDVKYEYSSKGYLAKIDGSKKDIPFKFSLSYKF